MVLKTIIRSCEGLGHQVDLIVIDGFSRPLVNGLFRRSRTVQVGFNLVRHFVLGNKSLNECVYWNAPTQKRIAQLVNDGGYALVVADMVRTAQFCVDLKIPWILDLDDLLSERYARLADQQDSRSLLGHFAHELPAPLRTTATWLANRLLRLEAARLASREKYFGLRASLVTLVSPVEARKLEKVLERRVYNAAMSVAAMPPVADAKDTIAGAVVFMGGLEYQPNQEALKHYVEHIDPALRSLGCEIELHVVGSAPVELRPAAHGATVVYLGYVADVAATLRSYPVFVAPILAEGGIKTKVLEAMSHGLAVVATQQAVSGLDLNHCQECQVASTSREFALAVQQLLDNRDMRMRLGKAARAFTEANFSPDVLQEKWRVMLDDATQQFREGRTR